MSAAIAASALSGIYFGKLNLGGIAASFIVITAAGYGKENGGAVAGTAVGTALTLTSGNIGTVLAEYAAGGLFAGGSLDFTEERLRSKWCDSSLTRGAKRPRIRFTKLEFAGLTSLVPEAIMISSNT
jgi:hypothetical protein